MQEYLGYFVAFFGAMALFTMVGMFGLAFWLSQVQTELKAMQKSTHTLTYIDPLQQQFSEKPTAAERKKQNSEETMGNIALEDTMGDLQ